MPCRDEPDIQRVYKRRPIQVDEPNDAGVEVA
jgi:hypothetical protein